MKQQSSRKLKSSGEAQFWQRRYYDFNVHNGEKRVEKLRYMHRNPVQRGLVEKPEEWPWSSFQHYATGKIGTIEIESEWTARRREAETVQQLRLPPFARELFRVLVSDTGGWPTLSFGVLILPKKWVPHPSLFSSEGWVYRQLRQLPKIFSAGWPTLSFGVLISNKKVGAPSFAFF